MKLEALQYDCEDEFIRIQFEDNPRYEERPHWKETFFLLEDECPVWPRPFNGHGIYERD